MVRDSTLYDKLGISIDASESQIKRAYIHLSKQWHPDKHPDEMKEEATKKFKDITDAKDILLDSEKRNLYDKIGMDIFKQNSQPNFNSSFNPFAQSFNPFGNNPFETKKQKVVEPIFFTLKVSLDQIYREDKIPITFNYYKDCQSCHGDGGTTQTCGQCNGNGKRIHIQHMGPMITQTILDCHSCSGKGHIIKDQCNFCHGKGTSDDVKLFNLPLSHAFVSGTRIHVKNEGNIFKQIKSDLIITIDVLPHPIFKRNKNNLMMSMEITLEEALFGFVKKIEYIDGNSFFIQCQTKTESYTIRAVEGMGINVEGSLCIIFTVSLPNVKTVEDLVNQFTKLKIEPEKLLHLSDISNPKDVLVEFLKL